MEGTNTLRIRGEPRIGASSNQRSRFQRDFQIPGGCNVKGIHAKHGAGILTVTFPYKTTQLPPPPPTELESKTTTQPPSQPPPKKLEPKTTTKQTPPPPPSEELEAQKTTQQSPPQPPPKKLEPKTTTKQTPPPPPSEELEAQKTTQQSPPLPPRRSQKDIQDQQSAGKTLISQKSRPDNTLPPPKEDQITRTPTITTPKGTSNSSRGGQTQPPDGSIENERRGEESADDQRQKGKEIVKKEEERGGTATATAGEEADGGWFKIEKYTKVLATVKRFAQTHLDHDNRELLANMGVAALITLAFGAYIYYALNSSLKSSEES